MRILLTNDDGYRALGINSLYHVLVDAGHDVIIVAPECNSSGAGQSITVYMPISITQISNSMYFVSSTPADSVRLGLQYVYTSVENYPDLVISGINMGENIGDDVFYSGTVGAAREGLMHNIPSLAVSTPGPEFDNLDSAARIVLELVAKLEANFTFSEKPFLWNINIPNKPYNKIGGFEATKLGFRPLHKPLERQVTPRGNVVFWQGDSSNPEIIEMGTDIDVFLKQEKVSITPIALLPTDYRQMPFINALTL